MTSSALCAAWRRTACACWAPTSRSTTWRASASRSSIPAIFSARWSRSRSTRADRCDLGPGALLHIGNPRRHAELAPADLRQRGDPLADVLVRWTGEAEPHPALAVALVGRPFRPRIDGDAARQRRLRQLLRVDDIGQLDPEENPTLGVLELRRGAELLGERLHQRLELGAQAARELGHVLVEMTDAELGQHHLLQRAGTGIGLE